MEFGIDTNAPVWQEWRTPLMPARNVDGKGSRRTFMCMVLRKEEVKPAPTREVLAIIECFTRDRASDRQHFLFAATSVVGSIG
jgi:hypothetical protein